MSGGRIQKANAAGKLKRKEDRKKNNTRGKAFLKAFLSFFLFGFMLLVFGPSEIFFANVTEFTFYIRNLSGICL